MSLEASSEKSGHVIDVERAVIEEQLERMLSDRHFSHSKRFPAFLRFVVEKTIDGEPDLLKERTLGVEIFGRTADYDTSQDPIVRVTAAEIRKRIAQYYQEPAHEEELRISLDTGSYVPQFHWPKERLQGGPSDGEVGHAAPVASVASGRSRWWKPSAALAAVIVATAGMGLAWHSMHRAPVNFFWGPLLNSGDPVLLCIVDQHQTTNLAVDAADPSRQIMVQTDLSSVNRDDLWAILRVGNVLLSHGKKFTMKGAQVTTLSDLQNGPTIFVGAFDNAWTMRLTKPLRFRFGNDANFSHEWISDSTSNGAPRWFTNRPVQENANNYREYAIVARFTDPDTGQLSVVVAGIGAGSTLAAGEFLSDPAHLGELERLAVAAGDKKNIEAVISTQIIDGQPGTPKIEATYFW